MISTITLYIHQLPGEPQRALTCDMSDFPAMYGAMLGTYEIQVAWEEIQIDPTTALIAQYERQIELERDKCNDRVRVLTERVNGLRCIEHKDADQ